MRIPILCAALMFLQGPAAVAPNDDHGWPDLGRVDQVLTVQVAKLRLAPPSTARLILLRWARSGSSDPASPGVLSPDLFYSPDAIRPSLRPGVTLHTYRYLRLGPRLPCGID